MTVPALLIAWSSVGWGNLTTQAEVAHQAFERAAEIAREIEDDLSVLQGALQGDAIALLRLGESGLGASESSGSLRSR